MEDLLHKVELWEIVGAIIAVVYGIIRGTKWYKESRWGEAFAILEAGVVKTYHDYVKGLKIANGGKLTEEQKQQARTMAMETAKTFASEKGFDLVKVLGKNLLPSLIEKIVSDRKATSALGKLGAAGPTSPAPSKSSVAPAKKKKG